MTGELICWATWNEIYVSLAMALILIISIITVAVINRKIPLKHFNEYRLTLISFGVCLVAWVFALVLGLLSLQYRLWGRIVFSLLVRAATNKRAQRGLIAFLGFVDHRRGLLWVDLFRRRAHLSPVRLV